MASGWLAGLAGGVAGGGWEAGWEAGWPQGLLELRQVRRGVVKRLFGGPETALFHVETHPPDQGHQTPDTTDQGTADTQNLTSQPSGPQGAGG